MKKQSKTKQNFNYLTSSIDEIAQHFTEITRAGVSITISYYSNNAEMKVKLEKAKLLSKIIKLQREYEDLYGTES